MDCRRAAPLGSAAFRATRIESEPLRPVPTQLEEILEVDETAFLQIVNQLGEHVIRRERSEGDQSILNAEFLVGEIVARVDCLSRQTVALESTLPDEHHRMAVRDLQG